MERSPPEATTPSKPPVGLMTNPLMLPLPVTVPIVSRALGVDAFKFPPDILMVPATVLAPIVKSLPPLLRLAEVPRVSEFTWIGTVRLTVAEPPIVTFVTPLFGTPTGFQLLGSLQLLLDAPVQMESA